jgi:hypothetical protein
MEYRFNEAGFGRTVRRALEEFMNRHNAEVLLSETDSQVSRAKQK